MAIDWTKSHADRFWYTRVAWPSYEETAELSGVTACTVEENALSSLKSGGSISYIGSLDIGDDMVRVYSESRQGGEVQAMCHGTFIAVSGRMAYGPATASGKADLYSVLKVLQDWRCDETYVVPAGSNPVEEAARICEAANLPYVAEPYGGTMGSDSVYDFDTPMLTVVNGLLGRADYASASVDVWGRVVMSRYEEPDARGVVATLDEEGGAVLLSPSFSVERDTSSIYNVVTFVGVDADGKTIRAQAINNLETSRWSTTRRRKIVSYNEQVMDETTQDQLQRRADSKLLTSMTGVERLEVAHPWAGFAMGDGILLDLPSRGIDGQRYTAVKRTCDMRPGMPCKTTMRRFVAFTD